MAIYDRRGAAERVGKSLRTIYRWEEGGLIEFTLGRVREADLLAADREARLSRGRPRKRVKSVAPM